VLLRLENAVEATTGADPGVVSDVVVFISVATGRWARKRKRQSSGLIHSGDSQDARSSSNSRHESSNCGDVTPEDRRQLEAIVGYRKDRLRRAVETALRQRAGSQ
jgi:hypothetical protein